MGLSELQVLRRVELPLGLPLVIAGIRIAAIFVIATATIAAIAGGGGLGEVIVNQASYGLAGVVGASLCVSAPRVPDGPAPDPACSEPPRVDLTRFRRLSASPTGGGRG